MPTLLFATHNPWKCDQFQPVFKAYGFRLLNLRDCEDSLPAVEETGASPLENALLKARQYHSKKFPWVFADDAGLEIEALGGEPGLQTRRWGGRFSDDITDQEWLDYLLERLQGVPEERRNARFNSGWVLIAPDGSVHMNAMNWPFMIASDPLRPIRPGSPITAVRVGPEDDLGRRRKEIRQAWERWGILKILVKKFGVSHE